MHHDLQAHRLRGLDALGVKVLKHTLYEHRGGCKHTGREILMVRRQRPSLNAHQRITQLLGVRGRSDTADPDN